jgi:hypothetical protein
MMKDWKKIAQASGLAIPEPDLERVAGPLNTLETAFRPLLESIGPETQLAVTFSPATGERE